MWNLLWDSGGDSFAPLLHIDNCLVTLTGLLLLLGVGEKEKKFIALFQLQDIEQKKSPKNKTLLPQPLLLRLLM